MDKLDYEARLNIPLSVGDLMVLEALSKKLQKNKTDRTTNRITKASIVRALIPLLKANIEELSKLEVKTEKELSNILKKIFVLNPIK